MHSFLFKYVLTFMLQYSQNMEISLMEKVAAMKRLELSLSKVTIELETRSSHLDELLQENREVKIFLNSISDDESLLF